MKIFTRGLFKNEYARLAVATRFILPFMLFAFAKAGHAQTYITESFDGTTFAPSGWTNSYISGSSDDSGPDTWQRLTGGDPTVHPASAPTHSGAGMAWYNSWDLYSGSEALLITPSMDFTAYSTGANTVTFWFYKTTDLIDGWTGNQQDQLNVWVNTSASLSGATLLDSYYDGIAETPVVTSMGWYQYTLTIPSSFMSSSHVYIIFDAVSDYATDMFLDDVSVTHVPPCSGTPSVTLTPAAGVMRICSGNKVTLSGSGGLAPGQVYQWQSATSSTGPWTNISGATGTSYTSGSISSTIYFRLKDSCTGSGMVAYTNADTVLVGSPSYASLPYVQDFESWQNFCNILDVPGGNWLNTPSSGDGSWRRDDQGCSSGGWSTTGCYSGPYSYYALAPFSPYTLSHGGSHCARFHSASNYGYLSASSTPWSGSLDLYVDCSGAGNKLLQFFFKNEAYPYGGSNYSLYNNDSLDVFLSTNGGASFTQIWNADTAQDWTKVRLEIASTSATTVIRFTGKRNGGDPMGYGYSEDYTDMGIDSVYVGPACSGVPSGLTVSPSGTVTGCPGASYTLNIGGLPLVGGLSYQWKQSAAPFSSFTNAVGGSGSTSYSYHTPTLFDSIQYEAVVTCASTSSSATTAATTIAFTNKPSYAAINLPAPAGPGYHYSFENWGSRCSSNDAPVVASGSTISNWANYPSTGENSWRRDDQGSSAGWPYYYTYSPFEYSPVSVDSSHSARRTTYYNYYGLGSANLYLFLDCSTVTGGKELQYYVNTKAPSYSGYSIDTLSSYLSTDGGATFSLLRQDYNGDGSWQFVSAKIPSNAAKTVIKFQSNMSYTYSFGGGVGLDNVKLLLPCSGKPTAGTLTGVSPCPNKPFTLQLSGTSQAAGLYYEWQTSTDGYTWVDEIGDTTMIGSFNFTKDKYVRCIVKCTNSGLSDTSNAVLITLKPFYKCYCNPTPANSYIYGGFGNVSITKQNGDTVMNHNTVPFPILNNSWAQSLYYGSRSSLHGYTNFTDTLAPSTVYLDSLYHFYLTEVVYSSYFYGGYPINVYIDYDHSGSFDATAGELVLNKTASSAASPTATDTVRIPADAQVGITGMRALLGIYQSNPLSPCGPGSYSYGEIRDYLINIDYRPCNGKISAGTAVSSDTIMCTGGYTFTLTDTTHEYHQSGISWNWQYSPDGVTWGSIPGTTKRDTLTLPFTSTTWYRMVAICAATHDTTYSNAVKVRLGQAYQCYCYSIATGGIRQDSSDIGAFTFGPFVMNKKGPHILNPVATGSHTNFTGSIIDLYVDSTYPVGLYHILRTPDHGDAKVTLFIDYNNNLRYDAPAERVWTAYTSAAYWYITTAITIPEVVVSDVPTGMRLILNNNVGANAASDEGCGTYTSGETMDFVVRFNRAWTAGVGSISNLENLMMYPNPTDGKFKVTFNSQQVIKNLQISVTNMTGQQVFARSYTNTQGQFNTEIDLSAAARGVYFVTFMADGERMIRKMVLK